MTLHRELAQRHTTTAEPHQRQRGKNQLNALGPLPRAVNIRASPAKPETSGTPPTGVSEPLR